MKPSEMCVTLETARRLKEAGFPQEDSYLSWVYHYEEAPVIDKTWGHYKSRIDCAAPTLAEVLRELPLMTDRGHLVVRPGQYVGYVGEGAPLTVFIKPDHEAAAILWLLVREIQEQASQA